MCDHECWYFKCQTREHAGKYAFMCREKGSLGCSFWGGLSIHFTFQSSYLFVIPLVVPEDLLKNPTIDYAKYDSTFMVFHIWGITIICYSAIRVLNSVPPDTTWILETPKSESCYPSSLDVFTTRPSSPDVFTTGGLTSFLGSQSQSSASGSKGRFFLTLSFFYN